MTSYSQHQCIIFFAVVSLVCVLASNAEASEATEICLINNTPGTLFIQVKDIDDYDWDGSGRPDHNWNNVTMYAGASMCRRAEVDSKLPHFTFIFNHSYIYRMVWAITDQGHPRWSWSNNSSNDLIALSGDNNASVILRGYEDFKPGGLCDSTNLAPKRCQMFIINKR